MTKESIRNILRELNIKDGSTKDSLIIQDITGFLRDIGDNRNDVMLSSLDNIYLERLYNIFFTKEIYNGSAKGIPDWSPYIIPPEDIINAMKTRKPLDLGNYRNKNIPDDAIL